jgi:protein-tyrosine kinase
VHTLSVDDIERLAKIAETKRIYWAIESALRWAVPSCVAITSSVPREGKTTMAATLAAAAASPGGKRVLLVDLDWYTPALHRLFGLDLLFEPEALDDTPPIENLVQRSGLRGLDILVAAKEAPGGAGLGADTSRFGLQIVSQARENYDLVVLDTCSVLRMNRYMMDPVNIAKAADGVALVVMANETNRAYTKRSHIVLESAGANVLGVIVNQWKNPLA